jgi:hypothetical protein
MIEVVLEERLIAVAVSQHGCISEAVSRHPIRESVGIADRVRVVERVTREDD